MATEIKCKILEFFQTIDQYYGCKTEITEGLYSLSEDFEASNTTWNLSEFTLLRSAFRKKGERLMMEGEKMYYEIAAATIVDFKKPGRNTYEFVELYGVSVYRITKIKFHTKY